MRTQFQFQDKPVAGITNKFIFWSISIILSVSSSFWVGYYKIDRRFDQIENKREMDVVLNRQVVEGLRQNEDLHTMQIKVNADIISELRNSNHDLTEKVKALELRLR